MAITINQCKKFLGNSAKRMSDEEITRVLQYLYAIAEIALNIVETKDVSTKQLEIIDSGREKK